jgi:hypothetical protein
MNRHNEAGPPKTIQGRRTVALDNETLDTLCNAHEQLPGNTWVFSTRNGTSINGRNLSRAYYQAIIQSGVPSIRFHDLRHTHASLLLAEGENLRVIADRLGHSQVSFTAHTYTRAATEAQRKKAEALAKRLRQDCGRNDQKAPEEDSGHSCNPCPISKNGADGRTRTDDLRFTKPLLYQLSYASNVSIITATSSGLKGQLLEA